MSQIALICGKPAIFMLLVVAALIVVPQVPNTVPQKHENRARQSASAPAQAGAAVNAVPWVPVSVNMSTLGEGFETTVAVNPADSSNIMVTPGVGLGAVNDSFGVARVSSDGGRTWRIGNTSLSNSQATTDYNWKLYDEVGTFDASGVAYFGIVDAGPGPNVSYLFKSTDGGNSFSLTSPFLKLNDSLLDYQRGSVVQPCIEARDYPGVIADQYQNSPYRNNVYVWHRITAQVGANCVGGRAFQRSTDGGKTWGSGMFYENSNFFSANRGMAVAPDGTVLLAGIDPACGGMILESIDGGATFSQLCVPSNSPGISLIEVAASSAKDLYVLFQGGDSTNSHLYSEVSQDGGSSWSAPARIDDVTYPDVTKVATVHAMWDFGLSQRTGRLDVAWLDWRNNGGNDTLADIYYSYSYDGLSWAPNLRVTSQGPYYYCVGAPESNYCIRSGNDYMWITSTNTVSLDGAYIVASMGSTSCGSHCTDLKLYTRSVSIAFPSGSVGGRVVSIDRQPLMALLIATAAVILAASLTMATFFRRVRARR